MKTHSLLLCLVSLAGLPFAGKADDILVSSVETPDNLAAYCIDDMTNTGQVTGPQQDHIIPNPGAMQIGDVGNPDTNDRIRKEFLLFHLPSLAGQKLSHATLRVFFSECRQEAREKALPPAELFHAEKWNDETWLSDPVYHGLETSHFSDNEVFSRKTALCESGDKPGFLELDVTDMIRADYGRSSEPVAVFRFEVSDREALDISDKMMNAYFVYGPGMLEQPGRVPTLILSCE